MDGNRDINGSSLYVGGAISVRKVDIYSSFRYDSNMTITLSNAKIRDLLNAHNQLDGYHEIATDKSGQKVAIPKSYIFPVRTTVDITKNIKLLREPVNAVGELRDEILKRISNGANEIDGEKEPTKLKEFVKEEADLWDGEVEVKGLNILKMESLIGASLGEDEDSTKRDSKKTRNHIPQTVLASLSPVLDMFNEPVT